MKIYHGHFTCREDILDEFCISDATLEGYEILYAEYNTAAYEGEAFVLLRKGDDLFEVNSSHCSCNGLSWRVEPTTKKALLFRPNVVENVKDLMRLAVML